MIFGQGGNSPHITQLNDIGAVPCPTLSYYLLVLHTIPVINDFIFSSFNIVIRHFIYPQNQSTPVKINKVPASKKMTFIPSNSLILGPFCVILNSVPLKKTGSLLWRAPILSLINTFRAMPVHVSQDYDNGSL